MVLLQAADDADKAHLLQIFGVRIVLDLRGIERRNLGARRGDGGVRCETGDELVGIVVALIDGATWIRLRMLVATL